MRDIVVALAIFGSVPVAAFRPDLGILAYIWIGLMNPHRLSWRLVNAPVGLAVALATLLGTVLRGEIRRIPMKSTTFLLILWFLYTTLTTMNAVSHDAWIEWNRFSRIILMCFVAMMLLQERKRLERYVWVAMASIAFFSVKGGLFSVLTRGNYRVWGPMGSFIEGNNELALAELMILPLMLYFLRQTRKPWQRWAYYAAFVLTIFSILFSYSRGAFVAFAGVTLVLMLRSRYRLQALIMAVVLGGLMVAFVPQEWKDRMFSIGQYQTDQSAQGRINAWRFATHVAETHLFGGGFRTFTKDMFLIYAPNPTDVHDAHSIYFEVLGEQGFPGLVIFLAVLLTTLWRLERLRRRAARDPERRWIHDLAEMLQFSLLGYMLGGAFLGLAYFDLPYYIVVSSILLDDIAFRRRATAPVPAVADPPEPVVVPSMAMNRIRWFLPALLAAAFAAASLGARGEARAQGSYVPAPPAQDSILYPQNKKDPRIAPHDAHNVYSTDPYSPKNEKKAFANNDYFSIGVNPNAAALITLVENAHLGPKNNPRGFWPRYNEGNKDQAFGELKYALWVFPNHPRALFLLGMLSRETKQPDIPIAYYEKALRLFPDRAYTRAQYGAYLVEIGEKTQGILQLEQALRMDPTLLTARAWLDKAKRSIGMEVGETAPAGAGGGSDTPVQSDGIYVPRR